MPVLWRPYHEMNGKWFWWGGRPGAENYTKLYRMLFDRLTNFHGLNNLICLRPQRSEERRGRVR